MDIDKNKPMISARTVTALSVLLSSLTPFVPTGIPCVFETAGVALAGGQGDHFDGLFCLRWAECQGPGGDPWTGDCFLMFFVLVS